MPIHGMHTMRMGGRRRFGFEYVTADIVGGSSPWPSSWTFEDFPIGEPGGDRLVIALMATSRHYFDNGPGNNAAITSVSFDGNSGTLNTASPSNQRATAIGARLIPAGTLSTIHFTLSSTQAAGFLATGTFHGLATAASHSQTSNAGSGASRSATITIPPRGVGLWVASVQDKSSINWSSGVEKLVELADYGGSKNFRSSVAALVNETDDPITNFSATASWSGSDNCAISAASFGP